MAEPVQGPSPAGVLGSSGAIENRHASPLEAAPTPWLFSGPKVVGWRFLVDLLLICLWVAVTDMLLYQVGTLLAWSIFLVWSVIFFAIVKRTKSHLGASWLCALVLLLLSAKLAWCGSYLQVACGVALIVCYTMALSGSPPFFPEVCGYGGHVLTGAVNRISRFRLHGSRDTAEPLNRIHGWQFTMPLAAVVAFAVLFVLANPDIANSVASNLRATLVACSDLWEAIGTKQVFFWMASAWLMLGLLYPTGAWQAGQALFREPPPQELSAALANGKLYSAFRNTLLSLIVLFTFYLTFEFATLWRRDFPDNFYYAGYAHQGAFWLTVALALATGLLSVMFQGAMLSDPRLSRLKTFAVVWSILNFLLSLAVFNRLLIYIDFNGMTRMRVIGLLGISCVVIGFSLVVFKLLKDKGFVWLVHRQLWVPVGGILVYALMPVDWLISRNNTQRILGDHLAPAVQIIAQPSTAEGMLPLIDLVNVEDAQIREGIRALLAIWARELEVVEVLQAGSSEGSSALGRTAFVGAKVWTPRLGHSSPWVNTQQGFSRRTPKSGISLYDFQLSERLLRQRLVEIENTWQPYYESSERREKALNEFYQYSYQWY
jgi:hypothetical protein